MPAENKKSTKGEVRKRVEEVLKIILMGGEFHDLCQYATDHGWGVSKRTIARYQTSAYELCEKRTEMNRNRLFARHQQQRRALYARAMEAGDLNCALNIAKDEAKLYGLYPPEQREVSGKGGTPLYGSQGQLPNDVAGVLSTDAGRAALAAISAIVVTGKAGNDRQPEPVEASAAPGDDEPGTDGTCSGSDGSAAADAPT